MISTRRAISAVLLTLGATALAVPAAQAAPLAGEGEAISPTATLDSLSTMAIPAEERAELPTTAGQLSGLNDLNKLNELHQLTDLVAPVTNMVPAVE